jgi:hypothetical protein
MVELLLQRLDREDNQFEDIAEWDTESGESPPEDFTEIYPEEMWVEEDPDYFIARIDGPYTVLTQLDGEQVE